MVNERGWVAVVLGLLFVVVALVGRVVLHRRRTGDWGLRWQRDNRTARLSGVLFVVAVLAGIVGTALVATGVTPTWSALDGSLAVAVGVALYTAGAAITLAAQSAMGASWRVGVRPGERTELVSEGLFRWVRNPIFTGMVVALAGLAVLAPTWVTAAAVVALVVAVEVQVRSVEEPYLANEVAGWVQYAVRAGRFVPNVGRWEA